MKIKVYDEFKTFREFINICKGIWRFLKRNNRTIKNLTVYITLCNENNKCEDINLYDEQGNIICENAALMIGDFPYIERKNPDVEKRMICCPESKILTQYIYNQNCIAAIQLQEEQTKLSQFIAKLPIGKYSDKSRKPLSTFRTIEDIRTYGYEWQKINNVLDINKKYSSYFWKTLDK